MEPRRLLTAMVEALNAHDIERSTAFFSEDVLLTLRPEPPGSREGTHRGRAYFRRWLQGLFDRDFTIAIEIQKVEGTVVQTLTTTSMKTTRRLGLAPLVGIEDYVIENAQITSLTWTATEETRRKFAVLRTRFFIVAGVVAAAVVALAWWRLAR